MISVIGAGPAGSYVSYLLAKGGEKVNLYEEHSEIGKPVQCTGITTSYLKDIIKEDKFVLNEIKKVRVISPNKSEIDFNLGKKNLVIDREKFDKKVFDMARDEGVKVFLKHKFIGCEFKDNKINMKINKKVIETDYLVGADGPLSSVAKSCDIFGKRSFLVGVQARVRGKWDPDVFSVYFGNSIAPGFFAWIVPESEKVARVGLATKDDPSNYFKKFVNGKIIDKQGGVIPIYDHKVVSSKDNVFLVGDSAMQIKNTTGGGVYPGLVCAEELSKSILEKKNYEKNWKKRIGKELKTGAKIRNILNKFSDNDYDSLMELTKKDQIRNLIEKHDREFPSKFLFKMILKEPRFLKFSKKLF